MATKGALTLNTTVDDILDGTYPAYSPITSLEYLAVGGGGGGGSAAGAGGGAGGFSTGTIPVTVAPFSYSGYFDGSTDYLITPSSSQFNLTGDFTIECWIYKTNPAADGNGIFGIGSQDPDSNLVRISSGVLQFWLGGSNSGAGGTGTKTGIVSCSTPILNFTWYHIALVRSGSATNNVKLYLNGVLDGQGTGTYQIPSNYLVIGRDYPTYSTEYFPGYISNLRVLKGTALYTANFAPPTAPLTAITNTSFLTLGTSFDDSSTNNLVITKNGNPKISNRSPFESPIFVNVGIGGTGSPATGTLGGNGGNTIVNSNWSGFFNNSTSDVIKVDSNATGFAIGTGNFTVEGWFKSVDYTHWQHLFHLGGSGHYGIVLYRSNSNNIVVQIEGSSVITYDFNPVLGEWYHFALVREGTGSNQTKLYINGISVATATSTGNISADNIFIGGINWGTGNNWSGYISNVRLLKGTALYTTNFKPSTSPLTAISATVLLTLQNSAFIDNSSFVNVITKLGSSSITNSTSPFEIKMIGGGGGGSNQNGTAPNGWASGGGDAGTGAGAGRGSSGIYGQGSPGGTRIVAGSLYGSGGGGGAGGIGGQGNGTNGGNGGAGLYSSITGSNVAYAGGGGGQTYNSYYGSGYGGIGGGGDANIAVGGYGGMYLGGGGGGGGASDAGPNYGGYGGTGVVILRHPIAYDIVGKSANAIDVSYSSGYKIYTIRANDTVYFNQGSTVNTPNVASVSCLVIGGGGGGGSTIGGGGGAGGFVAVEDYLIMRGNTVTVTVGAGGLSDNASGAANAFAGVNSTFGDIISYGGGGGASWANNPGFSGASSGGGAGGDGGFVAPTATIIQGQGSRGGLGGGPRVGGGGGGAGQYGFSGSTGEQKWSGNGGNGLISSITGTPTYYSGGGAGGVENGYTTHVSTGGLGGGGNMGYSSPGVAGVANTGGGGGAGSNPGGANNYGGSGGSGVVIISYSAAKYGLATSTTGSPTITLVNGNYVYKWTSSGSITY